MRAKFQSLVDGDGDIQRFCARRLAVGRRCCRSTRQRADERMSAKIASVVALLLLLLVVFDGSERAIAAPISPMDAAKSGEVRSIKNFANIIANKNVVGSDDDVKIGAVQRRHFPLLVAFARHLQRARSDSRRQVCARRQQREFASSALRRRLQRSRFFLANLRYTA